MSNEMQELTSSKVSTFQVHGIWAPGVILMRNLSFKAKASFVAALFYVPTVALLFWLYLSSFDSSDIPGVHQQFIAFMVAVLIVLGYFLAVFYKTNMGGISLASRHLAELADGDIRNRPPKPWGKDEPAILILNLLKVYDEMYDLIRRIRHSARELELTSAEVARVSADLALRTDASASNLGLQAEAVASINTQTKQSAQRTQEAAVMAQGNAEVAREGGQIISTAVETMRDIEISAGKINDIISVVDGLAFQTNILALNAAVEAARAGESGRGFAVVATEVRALAARSSSAAKEIKTLIQDSVQKISTGATVVDGAGRNIVELVSNAKQINLYLEEIALATRTQATEVDEVVNSIVHLDAHIQENAKMVKMTSASADSLSEQAKRLIDEIAKFKV